MTPKWVPSDDEIDGLARTLEPTELARDAAEQHRTRLLASAANARQLSRHSRLPMIIGISAALAAAAAVIIWIGLRPDGAARAPRANVIAIGDASFTREEGWPTYTIRVDRGRVAIDVETVEDAQQFIARTSDGQILVRSAQFVAGADKSRLTWVSVQQGSVELRHAGATIVLSAGQTWQPKIVQTAAVIVSPAPAAKNERERAESPTKTAVETKRSRNKPAGKVSRVEQPATKHVTASEDSTPIAKPTPTTPALAPPRPGELEFRAGVAALRGGDAAAAAKSFEAACAAAKSDALGDDACFWVGAAANRAGQPTAARDALMRFLHQFPSSPRAGEASALLGWLLYDAGDLDRAEARFKVAAGDRVPKVRESAERGLEAIKRKRVAGP